MRRPHRLSVARLEDRCLPAADYFGISYSLAYSTESALNTAARCFQQDLGRAPDGASTNAAAGLLQSGWSPQQLDALLVGSPEYVNGHGGPGAAWVRSLYEKFLGREPEAGAVETVQTAMANGMTAGQVALAITTSAERDSQLVRQLYAGFLQRAPEPAAVVNCTNLLVAGLDPRALEATLAASPEFRGHFGSDSGWLLWAFQDVLGRAPIPAEYPYWLAPAPAPQPAPASAPALAPASGASLYSDVIQQQSPTCFFAASLAAVAKSGVDLAGRVTYLGNNVFNVPLFNPQVNQYYQVTGFGPVMNVQVYFDGSTDPATDLAVPANGHFWPVLYQRAFDQVYGQSPLGGDSAFAVMTLTGQPNFQLPGANWAFGAKTPSSPADYAQVVAALGLGKPVVADTQSNGALVLDASTGLISTHSYTVVGADGGYVTLYNPWGVDTDWRLLDVNHDGFLSPAEAQLSPDGINGNFYDGLVRVSWATFQAMFNTLVVAA
jgi:hypothetical protein